MNDTYPASPHPYRTLHLTSTHSFKAMPNDTQAPAPSHLSIRARIKFIILRLWLFRNPRRKTGSTAQQEVYTSGSSSDNVEGDKHMKGDEPDPDLENGALVTVAPTFIPIPILNLHVRKPPQRQFQQEGFIQHIPNGCLPLAQHYFSHLYHDDDKPQHL
ncbi:hypothetical protein D9758_010719 [Tetrapyrgos nigripes]|uniref:Uncharacterized protein n=1 Tax=Tetrapyrgos nigripes TaxID=182062 RepID=A0A8H5LP59_9AGAR|nr:hypothetical protein D9758_010719 [Tetrapyrgos nigripes]